MRRCALSLLMMFCLLSGQANVLSPFLMMEVDTAEYVSPMDTTVYMPPVDTTHYEPVDTSYYEPVDTTYYEPVDTGEVVTPVVPNKPVIHVPTIREEDNVTEFPHNPVMETGQTDKQEFTMTIEGDYLRIRGTLMARGYGKHYIHCQIIGDSVHMQRFDMDPESTDMILHHIDIRIPGFTEDYYHVTLAEQNDVQLYKQYMMATARAVMRIGTDIPNLVSSSFKINILGSIIHCTAPDAVSLEVYTMDAVKVGEARFVNGEATVKVGSMPALYLYVVTYPDGRRESGKVVANEE